ncbi:MAG: hypothetical protein ACE5J4_02260 [Candidatus Aenigmatarchaeota archaeon]
MSKLWHGTARALGCFIEKEGLNPAGCTIVPPKFRKSCYSEPGYVYFTDKKDLAIIFACGTAEKVGLSNQGQIFEIDTKNVKVEKDPLFPEHSFRHKGHIPPNKIKSIEIIDCKK